MSPERSDRARSSRLHRVPPAARPATASPRSRFLENDAYRAEREWKRYEGTPQRELFRELRTRFLRRHTASARDALDVGAGPGRFTSALGADGARRVALDLSGAMLRFRPGPPGGPRPSVDAVDRVVGDALAPPFAPRSFDAVALVGNALGFAGEDAERLLSAVEALVRPRGSLIVEIAPGPGERSRYLARLPTGAVGRLFAAPPAAVVPRIVREGFVAEPVRHRSTAFARIDAPSLDARWRSRGWAVEEVLAIAPCLGADPAAIGRVAANARQWERLLAVEEEVGRAPARWGAAAAVLLAARRALGGHN